MPIARSIGSRALDQVFKVIAARELPLSEIELRIALEQLSRTDGSITQAAKLLGLNRRTLQRKLKRGFERRRKRRRGRSRRLKVARVRQTTI
jgi:DNA-binding NtrC family response regulator